MADDLEMRAQTQPLPTVEEVLSGDTQGGVPRPSCLKDDPADETVESLVPESVRRLVEQQKREAGEG